jgi:hypothetical protein
MKKPVFPPGLDKSMTVQWMSISSSSLPTNFPYSVPKVDNEYTFVHALIWGETLPVEGAGKLGDVWVSTLKENLGVWVCLQEGSWTCWPGNKGFDVDGRDPNGVHPYLKNRYLWFTGTTFLWNKAGSIRVSKCRWNQKIADQSNTDQSPEGPEDAVTAWIAVGPGKKRNRIGKTEGRVSKKQRVGVTSVVAGPLSGMDPSFQDGPSSVAGPSSLAGPSPTFETGPSLWPGVDPTLQSGPSSGVVPLSFTGPALPACPSTAPAAGPSLQAGPLSIAGPSSWPGVDLTLQSGPSSGTVPLSFTVRALPACPSTAPTPGPSSGPGVDPSSQSGPLVSHKPLSSSGMQSMNLGPDPLSENDQHLDLPWPSSPLTPPPATLADFCPMYGNELTLDCCMSKREGVEWPAGSRTVRWWNDVETVLPWFQHGKEVVCSNNINECVDLIVFSLSRIVISRLWRQWLRDLMRSRVMVLGPPLSFTSIY